MKVCVPVLSRHMCTLPWLWAGKMGLSAVVAFLWYIFSISLQQKACIIACLYATEAFGVPGDGLTRVCRCSTSWKKENVFFLSKTSKR